jgi:hypothetical protein
MIELLKTLKDTPLPSILVIGGILFLLLSFVRKIGRYIELEPTKVWLVGFIGVILLFSGVGLYLIPAVQNPLAVNPSGTQTNIPVTQVSQSVNPSQITPQPTQPASTITGERWDQEVVQVPESGTTLKWELSAGQLLYLGGGQIRINSEYCGGESDQICVLLFQATEAQTVIVDALIPKNNWYGISSTLTSDEALSEKEPQFWSPSNCINGCKKATIFYFIDGRLVKKIALTP